MFDMGPAAGRTASVVREIDDDQLDAATPCDIAVRDLLVHVLGFAEAFRQGATKESIGRSVPPTQAPHAPLPVDWRDRIVAQLDALAAAWRDPTAWEGDTEAGGVTMPAGRMAVVALDEIVVHGWDLARATGRPYAPADDDLDILMAMLEHVPDEGTPGLFGPVVRVAPDAPLLDQVIGRTGRDPAWTGERSREH